MHILKEIEEQHPECAALVFRKYGEGELEVTAENILALVQKYGVQFSAELATAITDKMNQQ